MDSEKNKIKKFLEDFLEITSKYTVQLFRLNENGNTIPHGTGVFFEYNNIKILLTAGHNFVDEDLSNLFLATPKEMILLEGETIFSPKLNAIMDFGIVLLNDRILPPLENNFSFLNFTKIEIGHKQRIFEGNEYLIGDNYFVLGFPASKTKLKYKSLKEWKSKGVYFSGYCLKSKIEDLKKEFPLHLFLDYQPRMIDVNNIKKTMPSLKGMSGGGLWVAVKSLFEPPWLEAKLVGIFIELKGKSLIFVRIDVFTEFFRDVLGFKEIPKSPYNLKF